jgi:hypothetical protein
MSVGRGARCMPPLRLTDSQITAIFAAVRPLAVQDRHPFLQGVASLLAGIGILLFDPSHGSATLRSALPRSRHGGGVVCILVCTVRFAADERAACALPEVHRPHHTTDNITAGDRRSLEAELDRIGNILAAKGASKLRGAKALVVPSNVSPVPLPPRAPELNGQENIWQFMRQNWLSNRIFKSFDDIVDHCCYAWNTLIDQPWKIMSIARRDWAAVDHSIRGLV